MNDASQPSTPTLRQVVLDGEDARALAEFYRQLLGYHHRPGDERFVYADPAGHPFCIFVAS
jgi:hypothetical protein